MSSVWTAITAGTYWLFVGIATLGFLFFFCLLPETKGKSLEDVEELFSKPWCSCCSKRNSVSANKTTSWLQQYTVDTQHSQLAVAVQTFTGEFRWTTSYHVAIWHAGQLCHKAILQQIFRSFLWRCGGACQLRLDMRGIWGKVRYSDWKKKKKTQQTSLWYYHSWLLFLKNRKLDFVAWYYEMCTVIVLSVYLPELIPLAIKTTYPVYLKGMHF